MESADVAIIGGGTIGLSVAGRLADSFNRVVLFDRNYTAREATYASGGMLAPFMEVEFGERSLLELNHRSLELFPEYCRTLERETDSTVELREYGSYYVATDEQQIKELNRLAEYQTRLGIQPERLTKHELLEREPSLTEAIKTGIYFESEKHVNNRLFGLALNRRADQRGVDLRLNDPVQSVSYGEDGRVEQVDSRHSSLVVSKLVVTAGAWSGEINGLKPEDSLPVRPVKGQAFSVRPDPDNTPDAIVRSSDFYCVPHTPERAIIGASMEERGFAGGNTAGEIMELLDQSARLIPGLRDQELLETWWGFRPGTLDNNPIIGPSSVTPNLYFATGHYRNGILLTPITEKLLGTAIIENRMPEGIEPFLPKRFQNQTGRASKQTA